MSKFNFNIDIEDNEMQSSLSKSKYNSMSQKKLYEINQYIVDLGLPSGTRWCRYNLGCDFHLLFNHPEDTKAEDWYRDYYAWGEIKTKPYYVNKTYTLLDNKNKLTKYCTDISYWHKNIADNLTQLLQEDDAAYQNLHIENYKFRIPSKNQFVELLKFTKQKWVHYQNIKKLEGIELTSILNNNKLFIPENNHKYEDVVEQDGECGLWTSNLHIEDPIRAIVFFANESILGDITAGTRSYGLGIRPVLENN